jgi:hypothetical protein
MIRQKEDRSPKHNRSRQNHRAAERQRAEDGGQTTDYGTANMGQSSASIGVHLRLCCSFLPGAAGAHAPYLDQGRGWNASLPGFVCFVCFVVASGVIVPRSAFRIPRLNVLFLGFLP